MVRIRIGSGTGNNAMAISGGQILRRGCKYPTFTLLHALLG